jgi:hypothetical protein
VTVRDQAVPDAPHGDDQLGIVGVILDLHPQAADVGVDEPGVAEVLVAPHPLEELVAREHRAGVVGELAQQAELGLGEAELVVGLQHDPLLAAQLDVAELRVLRGTALVSCSCTRRSSARMRAASSWARPAW